MVTRKLFNYWISKQRSGFYTFIAAALVLCYFAGAVLIQYELPDQGMTVKRIAFIGALILAVVVLIHMNLNAYYQFLGLFQDTDHLPQKQISYVNSFCMTVFLMATVIGMFLLVAATEPVWQAIADWWANKPPVETSMELPEELMPTDGAMMPDLEELFGEAAPPSPFAEALSRLAEIIGYVLIIVFCILFFKSFGQAIWRFLTKPRHFDDDEKIYLKPTLNMPLPSVIPQTADKPESGLRYMLSYTARIRRHYKKEILDRRKQQNVSGALPVWASPQELEDTFRISNRTLHQLYEKARYSQRECTEEDWNRCISKSNVNLDM